MAVKKQISEINTVCIELTKNNSVLDKPSNCNILISLALLSIIVFINAINEEQIKFKKDN